MVNGIVFPPCFLEEGVRIDTECYIRILEDVYLPRCKVRFGTDTTCRWRQEDNAPSHTRRRTKAFLKEREIQLLTCPPCSPDLSPLDFHLWQEWETALGDRSSSPSLRCAINVRTMSELDPETAEKACVRASCGHVEHRL